MTTKGMLYVVESDVGFMEIVDDTQLDMGMTVLYQSTDYMECWKWCVETTMYEIHQETLKDIPR